MSHKNTTQLASLSELERLTWRQTGPRQEHRDGSQPHQRWRDAHASCRFMCRQKVSLVECLRLGWGKRFKRGPCDTICCTLLSTSSNSVRMPLLSVASVALSPPPFGDGRRSPESEALCQLFGPRFGAFIVCGRSCCIRSKLFVVRSDCYSSLLCNILK